MESELISIVVPVYKVEEYIRECIDSILCQTYSNFELILVDDGSPDNCGEICDNYAKIDNRIRVIHKENGGLSDARNVGIDIAKGKYITFVDSDDYISKEYLSELYRTAIESGADIVQGAESQQPEMLDHVKEYQMVEFPSMQALKDMFLFDKVQVMAWAKLYKSYLFQEIRYPTGKVNEDNFTTYKLIVNAKTVVCIPRIIYYYRVNPTGIMNKKFSESRFDILQTPGEIMNYFSGDVHEFQKEFDYYVMRLNVRLYNEIIATGNKNVFAGYLKKIRKTLKQYNVKSSVCDEKYRRMIKMFQYSEPMYRLLIKTLRK